ncbi:MAG TPA: hypothetical protein VFE78_35790 [Gemmataceae bacterium]|jgi:hypothetical protein|nr:hypothetical protein [Gemmataceae bacterium]
MGCRRRLAGWVGVFAGLLAAGPAPAQTGVPLEQVVPAFRDRVRAVLAQPTLSTRGPAETFNCQPAVYHWLLDHPDLAVRLWYALGARCAVVEDRGGAVFGWHDEHGSDVRWQTVLHAAGRRLWYAEGRVKPGVLLPMVSFQAVIALDYTEGHDREGRPALRHQIHMYLHTDSHAAALAAKLVGASAPRLAEQYVAQLEMFFGGMAWYLDQNPERAKLLMQDLRRRAAAPDAPPALSAALAAPAPAAPPAAAPARLDRGP